jgi:uncharacterized protein YdaU (DUF1376 family)
VIYFKLYGGDYVRDTGDLTLEQHGAYLQLLLHYYGRGEPFANNLKPLYRLCRATKKSEKSSVKTVAEKFFPVSKDGLRHNCRADREIDEWKQLVERNRLNGKKGGRPPRNPDGIHLGSETEPSGLILGSPRETQKKPIPQPQPESESESGSRVLEDSDSRPQQRTAAAYRERSFHDLVLAAYHQALPDLPAVRDWNQRRRTKLIARISERLKAGRPADTVRYWEELFAKVAASDFLCGRKTDWRCPGLEWILEPRNFTKVIEGSFDNHERGRGNGGAHAQR